jgi:tetraacyldisaccharide 4'-kinase
MRGPAPQVPVLGVDNLTLGGSGQTAVLRWLARCCASHGAVPGVLLSADARRDAALVRRVVPSALVAVSEARDAAALQAVAQGATVLLADEVERRADLVPTKLLLVLSAETGVAAPWTVPAGPWREPLSAVCRADAVVITRRRATPEAAAALADRVRALGYTQPIGVAYLGLVTLEGLVSGRRQPASVLAGHRVVACAGLSDPDAFSAQVKGTGAAVQVAVWRTADAPRDEDVAWLAHAARKADFVVVPERVGVLLRDRWPAMVPEPLVALAEPTWESGEAAVAGALLAVLDASAAGTRPLPSSDGA